jgi:hypothetical protein
MARVIEQGLIFRDDCDREDFIRRLSELSLKHEQARKKILTKTRKLRRSLANQLANPRAMIFALSVFPQTCPSLSLAEGTGLYSPFFWPICMLNRQLFDKDFFVS